MYRYHGMCGAQQNFVFFAVYRSCVVEFQQPVYASPSQKSLSLLIVTIDVVIVVVVNAVSTVVTSKLAPVTCNFQSQARLRGHAVRSRNSDRSIIDLAVQGPSWQRRCRCQQETTFE